MLRTFAFFFFPTVLVWVFLVARGQEPFILWALCTERSILGFLVSPVAVHLSPLDFPLTGTGLSAGLW